MRSTAVWSVLSAALLGILAGVALTQSTRAAPAESKGFRSELLATLDLAGEIDGMEGRQLRMRRIRVEPGGQFALHDHRDRPGLFLVQEGTITEYPEGAEPREHGAGQVVAVGSRTRHWEENRGQSAVVVIAVDIVRK